VIELGIEVNEVILSTVTYSFKAPDAAEMMLDIISPYITGENKEGFQIYGTEKTEWQEVVHRLINPDEIRPQFGGTKPDDD
jgi:hypothetical protein